MQIVIEIPDRYYEILPKAHNGSIVSAYVLKAAKNGKILPKNHGRLGDLDKLFEQAKEDGAYDYVSAKEIADAPTIIEADTESEDN